MNNAYRNILVPYDGSSYSKRALQLAKLLAKAHQAKLHIVNVVSISQVTTPGRFFSSSEQKSLDQIKKTIKESSKSMIDEIQKNCESEGITTKSVVLDGQISEKILRFIKENNIDLVVIGSRGLSGISKIMTLGSVSRTISELADCPVTIVH